MARPESFLVACDVGSSKVCVLIGERNERGSIDILGKGTSAQRGSRKGNIINVDATVEAIKRAAEEAEIMAGVQITRVYAGLSGSAVRSFNSRGVVAVSSKGKEIGRDDIARVIDAAKSIQVPQDHEIVHAIPREFAVDGQEGIADPLGMVGARLEANVHIVTAPVAVAQNLAVCLNKSGIEVIELVLEQFAAAEAVLTSDEKELGVCLADLGGGTTEIAVYVRGAIAHTAVIPVGGDNFTNDLAVVLHTAIPDAERIKKKWGTAQRSSVSEDEMVEVPMVGGRTPKLCPRTMIAEILQPRAEELMALVREEVRRQGLESDLRAGYVLTGGASELPGLLEVSEQVFDGPVRAGAPSAGIGGLVDVVSRPEWSVAAGLLLYGARTQSQRKPRSFSLRRVKKALSDFF